MKLKCLKKNKSELRRGGVGGVKNLQSVNIWRPPMTPVSANPPRRLSAPINVSRADKSNRARNFCQSQKFENYMTKWPAEN